MLCETLANCGEALPFRALRSGLITSVNLTGELLLFGHKVQEPIKLHLLHR
jgi:hypothetical protein